jgi:drug/metabolite transporter (DMT)-like permease
LERVYLLRVCNELHNRLDSSILMANLMSPIAVILLLMSAFTHAGWNFISKREHPTLSFYLVANIFGTLCVLPILYFYRSHIGVIPTPVWVYVTISGFCLAVYMALLAGAYRYGDLSIAYPIARSLPVVIVTAGALIIGRDTLPRWPYYIGMIFVVGGCILLPLISIRDFSIKKFINVSCLLAVLSAIFISGYTIVDHEALRFLREQSGSFFNPINATLIYMALEAITSSIWKGILVFISRKERGNFIVVMREFKGAAAMTGIGIYFTYGLVLALMNYVSNIGYVAIFRQLSIPLGAIFGIILLKESKYPPKILGIIIIVLGLVFVGFG